MNVKCPQINKLYFFLLLTLPQSKYTFSRRKFAVESRYAHNFSVQVRVKMFQIKTVLNFWKVKTNFGPPCIWRLLNNYKLFPQFWWVYPFFCQNKYCLEVTFMFLLQANNQLCLTPVLLRVFPKHIFQRGSCCNPLWIINTEGHITLLLPVYTCRYGHPLSVGTTIPK